MHCKLHISNCKTFTSKRHLNNNGFSPKIDLKPHHITKEDIEEVFGACTNYRTTNPNLLLKTRKELLALYKKVYGSSTMTNNEFMKWFVTNYIIKAKGHPINWVTLVWLQ